VTIDGVWIGNRIYWTLETRNYNYSAIANSHTVQFTTARTKSSESAVSSPVFACLQSRSLATSVSAGFTILAFSRHGTISYDMIYDLLCHVM
jgi:hypothetical protein